MGGIFRNKEAMFVLFLRGRRADFKAGAILVLEGLNGVVAFTVNG